jgi:DNA-binding NtrC family response regulator
MPTILVVDDVKTFREQYAYDIRRKTGFEVLTAGNGREALELLASEEIDVVILDLEMPLMDGLEMLEIMAKEGHENVQVIVYTAKGDFQRCVRATQLGAYNFFAKDEIALDQLIREIENALSRRELIIEDRALQRTAFADSLLIGKSAAINQLRESIQKVAEVPSNVLIIGESGTGKELVAHEIHRLSARAKKRFVAVNCAAIPENLVESELFGFEKGAFSGAIRTMHGLCSQRHNPVYLNTHIHKLET